MLETQVYLCHCRVHILPFFFFTSCHSAPLIWAQTCPVYHLKVIYCWEQLGVSEVQIHSYVTEAHVCHVRSSFHPVMGTSVTRLCNENGLIKSMQDQPSIHATHIPYGHSRKNANRGFFFSLCPAFLAVEQIQTFWPFQENISAISADSICCLFVPSLVTLAEVQMAMLAHS